MCHLRPTLTCTASAITRFVGSFSGAWAIASVVLIAASNIAAETESFTNSSDVALRSKVTPEGVVYLASWIDSPNSQCFQIIGSGGSELASTVDRRSKRFGRF
jgi:hypothetical protein